MKINNICFYYRGHQDLEIKRPDGLNQFLLLFMRKKVAFCDGEKEIETQANTIILFDKQNSQPFEVDGSSYVIDWIDFELDEEEKKQLLRAGFPMNIRIQIQDSQTLLDILRMMQREFYAEQPQQEKMLLSYFRLFFAKLYEAVMEEKVPQKQPQYERLLAIRAEIYADPSKRMTVKELADKAYLSVSYFQHLYKEYFHTSVVADMICSRVERGKYLLSSTNYSVKEIAEELNYGSDVLFVQQFRKVTGISPGKYKEQFAKLHESGE